MSGGSGRPPHLHTSTLPHVLLGAGFLILYAATLAPGLLPADAGEYQLTGALLGVAHPPGFALYTLASWVISRLPGVSPATAINGLSALLAAGTLALLSRASARLWSNTLAGLAGAAVLGLSTTFWAQATTANIRMPAAFATAWALERLANYRALLAADRPGQPAALAWLALALGVGVSHHASLVFVAALLGGYALWLRPSALRRPWPLLAGALPFVAWLYFPLRTGAYGAPPGIGTLRGFLEHVLALGFRGDLFFFAKMSALPERLAIFANILTFEFTAPVLALMGLGAVAAFWRSRSLAAALLAAVAVHVFVAMTYRAPQTVEYLMPAYVLMGAWAAGGVAGVARAPAVETAATEAQSLPAQASARADEPRKLNFARTLRLAWPYLAAVAAAWALAAQWQATAGSYRQLARDDGTRAYAEGVLEQAPEGAVVLAAWHWATPLWYLQEVEGLRRDVEVRYVFPRGESLAQNWVDEINAALPERPVVVTSFFADEYGALPWRFVPLGPAWQVSAEPLRAVPPGLGGARDFGAWRFLGYRVEALNDEGLTVTAAWQGMGAPDDISFFVHLIGPDGSLHSQQDVTRPAARYQAGEVLVDRYTLALAPEAPPGAYRLVAGAYRPAAPEQRLAELDLQTVEVTRPSTTVRVPAGAAPLGGAMWLARASIFPAGPVQSGETVRVRLDFIAARPLTHDYTVSVGLIGPEYRWQARQDGTPAGGAIPTLKWIRGSRVTDTHTLTIPAEAAPGRAAVTLVVYDAFTQGVVGSATVGEVDVIGNQ
jgi:hypothetical protein